MFYAAQGINYDKPPTQNSTPEFDKISIDLDRIDKIEKKINYYEFMDQLWLFWQKKMTSRETDVFHKRYMQDKKVVDIAADLTLSETRIYVLLKQLETKYREFAKENSQYL